LYEALKGNRQWL
jgi:hypothetical protein